MSKQGGQAEFTLDDLDLVYLEMRRIARWRLKDERTSHTLASSDLTNQTLLRFLGEKHRGAAWTDPRAFLASFAASARNVLVDHARARATSKRGKDWRRVPFDAPLIALRDDPSALVSRIEILDGVAASNLPDPTLTSEIVRLRVLCGLNEQEAASSLGIDRAKVGRLWRSAKAWLQQRITDAEV